MEVILKEDVPSLGHRGDVVKVADGYGRNYLLPRKLAMQATAANKAVIEQMKTSAARRAAGERAVAEELAAKLAPVVLSFTRKTGDQGHLFGSVTSADIAAGLAAQGFEIDGVTQTTIVRVVGECAHRTPIGLAGQPVPPTMRRVPIQKRNS